MSEGILNGILNIDVIVSMASRRYGEGRIFIHTDRLAGVQTGHGANPKDFWRKVKGYYARRLPPRC